MVTAIKPQTNKAFWDMLGDLAVEANPIFF